MSDIIPDPAIQSDPVAVDPEVADAAEDAADAPVETPSTPKELVAAIQSELGTITYTDNKGAFDQTMARVAALVSELSAQL